MEQRNVTWISIMGPPPVYVDVLFDDEESLVFATPETIEVMAKGWEDAGILSEEEDKERAEYIRSLPVVDGLVDVTEVGGGFGLWLGNING